MRLRARLRRRRDDQRLAPQERAALGQALEEHDRLLLEAGRRVERRERWLRERVEAVEAAPLDEYFQGLLAFGLSAGVDALRELHEQVELAAGHHDGPSDELRELVGRLQVDEHWENAAVLVGWGYVARIAAGRWPSRYDEVIDLARLALPCKPPTIADVVEAAPREASRFHARLVRVLAAELAEDPSAPTPVLELLVWWPDAWTQGWTLLAELHNAHFPAGAPAA